MRKVKIEYISKKYKKLEIGQKILHPDFGEGLIVGFSEVSGEPFCFFKDSYNKSEFELICIVGDSFIA